MTADDALPIGHALPDAAQAELRRAVLLLENSGLASRITGLIGKPVDLMMKSLPAGAERVIHQAIDKALRHALDAALLSVDRTGNGLSRWRWLNKTLSSDWFAKASVAVSGGAGGALGLPGTLVELPLTTTLVLRSIAQIGQLEGEDVAQDDFKLACLAVFALGGPNKADDSAESGYFAVRLVLANTIADAAGKPLAAMLPGFLTAIAERFAIPVTLKFSAQLAPAVGGVAGSTINYLFIDHFQDKARGHFIVRRLEREHGPAAVRQAYDATRTELAAAKLLSL
ncbi:MAG: EcsC family protein [Alphaproteobacteria bacterium]|jgi:hypothetical protein|nr:EcsC family protein [Alphaproteobacteria bacterium]